MALIVCDRPVQPIIILRLLDSGSDVQIAKIIPFDLGNVKHRDGNSRPSHAYFPAQKNEKNEKIERIFLRNTRKKKGMPHSLRVLKRGAILVMMLSIFKCCSQTGIHAEFSTVIHISCVLISLAYDPINN
jgi:hypothetical protein